MAPRVAFDLAGLACGRPPARRGSHAASTSAEAGARAPRTPCAAPVASGRRRRRRAPGARRSDRRASSPPERCAQPSCGQSMRLTLPRSRRSQLIARRHRTPDIAAVVVGGRSSTERDRTGSIYHPHARFVPQPTPTLPNRRPRSSPGRSTATTRTTRASSPRRPRFIRPSGPSGSATGARCSSSRRSSPADTLFQLGDNAVLIATDTQTGDAATGYGTSANSRPPRRRSSASTVCVTVLARDAPAITPGASTR